VTLTHEINKRLRLVVPPIIGACVFGYFVYHAVQGDRGIMAWLRMTRELAESQAILADVQSERQTLEHRVALLNPNGLDPDLLDERARAMLNVAEADDRLVMIPNAPNGAGSAGGLPRGN
jgi:cell division protein FtsB